jgi:phosphoserine aminotransferase
MLAEPVLKRASDEMLNYRGTGKSVMEMSHRSKEYSEIHQETQSLLREQMEIPDNYKILFLQGGASLQFTMAPMNLMGEHGVADYVVTGSWGKKAVKAAELHGKANVVFDAKNTNYDHAPRTGQLKLNDEADFLHITLNETIQGVDFLEDPEVEKPVVCDMSSVILSRKMKVGNYGLIYAGAQKNLGPAGLTVVIVREDLLEAAPENLPPMLDYKNLAESDSLYNTPPTYSIYLLGLTLKWIKDEGGLNAIEANNEAKAKILYDAIDNSDGFYKGHAQKASRSRMNVVFTLEKEDLTAKFIEDAKAADMEQLKGHRSVGGCRASIYNAFPIDGCQRLADFMKEFAMRNG